MKLKVRDFVYFKGTEDVKPFFGMVHQVDPEFVHIVKIHEIKENGSFTIRDFELALLKSPSKYSNAPLITELLEKIQWHHIKTKLVKS